MPSVRDLDEGECWYKRHLALKAESDRLGRAQCLAQLGSVAYERFRDARNASRPEAELLHRLSAALKLYLEALDLIPADAVNELAAVHTQLDIYNDSGNLEKSLTHFRKSIGHKEAAGNGYGAAQTRFNVAAALARRGRLADAKEYAVAALRGFQDYSANEDVLNALKLIADMDRLQKAEATSQKSEAGSQKSE